MSFKQSRICPIHIKCHLNNYCCRGYFSVFVTFFFSGDHHLFSLRYCDGLLALCKCFYYFYFLLEYKKIFLGWDFFYFFI